jgi:hypothetical protein
VLKQLLILLPRQLKVDGAYCAQVAAALSQKGGIRGSMGAEKAGGTIKVPMTAARLIVERM